MSFTSGSDKYLWLLAVVAAGAAALSAVVVLSSLLLWQLVNRASGIRTASADKVGDKKEGWFLNDNGREFR